MARGTGTSVAQPYKRPRALVPVLPVDFDARPFGLLYSHLLRSYRVRRHLLVLYILTSSLLGIYNPNSLMTHSCISRPTHQPFFQKKYPAITHPVITTIVRSTSAFIRRAY